MYDSRLPVKQVVGTLAAKDLSATGLYAYYDILAENCQVQQIYCRVTTDISSTGAVVVTFYARPTIGSSSNQLTIGTISIPASATAGQTVYKWVDPVSVPAGYQLIANVSTAATTSGAALAIFGCAYSPEEPQNIANFVASA